MSVYCAQDNHGDFYRVRYPPRESPIAAEIDSNLFFNHLGDFLCRLHLHRGMGLDPTTSWGEWRTLGHFQLQVGFMPYRS
jgi:hypothetical protein